VAASKQSVSVDNFVKMTADAKILVYGTSYKNLVNKADDTVKDFNSVYFNICL